MKPIYWFVDTLAEAALKATCSLQVIGRERCLNSGGAIIAANHASYLDPPIVACGYRREISFLARNTLFRGVGGWLYPRLNAFPIDRGSADLKSMKTILHKLQAGQRILIFPEGTRTPDGRLQGAKAGIGMLVAKSGVPVQPIRIFGSYEAWPRGGQFRPGPITLVIGDPIRFEKSDLEDRSREGYQRLADRLMTEIANLSPEG